MGRQQSVAPLEMLRGAVHTPPPPSAVPQSVNRKRKWGRQLYCHRNAVDVGRPNQVVCVFLTGPATETSQLFPHLLPKPHTPALRSAGEGPCWECCSPCLRTTCPNIMQLIFAVLFRIGCYPSRQKRQYNGEGSGVGERSSPTNDTRGNTKGWANTWGGFRNLLERF